MGPTGEPNASPWLLARVADLGAPDLAARARLVDDEDVASLARGLPRLIATEPSAREPAVELEEVAEVLDERAASPRSRTTARPDEVVLSGGGRIVVHERGGARVIEVPPVIVRRDSPEARAAEARQRAAIERQAEREREAAQRTQAIIARAEAREREVREARATLPPAPTAPPTTIVAQPIFGGFPFGGFGTGALGVGGYGYTYGPYAPSTWGSVGFPATPRRPTDALTPGAVSPRFDARLPFGTWRD
ncbi:MAG: hypothetical protein OHK0013_47490 [Sandaracinaceae bacterium]